MSSVYKSLIELIGSTPLVELSNIERELGLKAKVIVKIESFNPGGSVKDRAALSMIDDAERSGVLKSGATLIEPTSGNTGIGLAWIAAIRGYRLILTMPETMSVERRQLLAAYGAEIVLTSGAKGMSGAIAKAEELNAEIPGSMILRQFDNPANPAAHEATTAEEIWRDTDGLVDVFVAGVGTGGTVTGTARGLKARNADIKVVAVEPAGSPVLEGGVAGAHQIQGIGAGFVPGNYDSSLVDRVVAVSDDDAFMGARMLVGKEGVLAGVSSGAAVWAAIELARLDEYAGKNIVVLLPDTGERYLSTPLFKRG